jgi:hypothetical protein
MSLLMTTDGLTWRRRGPARRAGRAGRGPGQAGPIGGKSLNRHCPDERLIRPKFAGPSGKCGLRCLARLQLSQHKLLPNAHGLGRQLSTPASGPSQRPLWVESGHWLVTTKRTFEVPRRQIGDDRVMTRCQRVKWWSKLYEIKQYLKKKSPASPTTCSGTSSWRLSGAPRASSGARRFPPVSTSPCFRDASVTNRPYWRRGSPPVWACAARRSPPPKPARRT